MYDVVTFGETMIRLSPPSFRRLEQTTLLDVNVGGGEMNVAVGCARLGLKAAYVTRLTSNALGRMIENKVREHGVDTSHIIWTKGDRVGLYFVEFGAAPRASNVLYDRAASAVSKIQPGEVDWNPIFSGTRVFHISGITPALSQSAAAVSEESMKAAREAGCTVTCDLNYRAKLWSEEEANQCMTRLMEYTDILITTEEDTGRVFGLRADSYEAVAEQLQKRFGFRAVMITLREDLSVWRNRWSAMVLADGAVYKSRVYDVEIVDRVGAGDSCSAGFIYGYLSFEGDWQQAIDYGAAYSALKHTFPGDLQWSTLEEVRAQIKGAGLRVTR